MNGFMDEFADAESMDSPIEENISGIWDPIPVSPNMEEVVADTAGEDGEVDQPTSTFRVSMSGNFECDP